MKTQLKLSRLRGELGKGVGMRLTKGGYVVLTDVTGKLAELGRRNFRWDALPAAKFGFPEMAGRERLDRSVVGGRINKVMIAVGAGVKLVDFLQSDDARVTLSGTLVNVASDVAKGAAAAAAAHVVGGWVAGAITGAAGVAGAPVLVVAVAGVAVVIAVGVVLDLVDERFEITRRLADLASRGQRAGEQAWDDFLTDGGRQLQRLERELLNWMRLPSVGGGY